MKLLCSLVLVLTCFTVTNAQESLTAVPFLLISPDTRTSGMGDAGVALSDNANAAYWNAGAAAFQYSKTTSNRKIGLTYSQWLPQADGALYYTSAFYTQNSSLLGGRIAANFTFLNLGEGTRRDASRANLGTYRSYDFALGVTYSAMITDDWGIGVQGRYISSHKGATSPTSDAGLNGQSGSFDMGVLWQPQHLNLLGIDADNRLSFGLSIRNVGPKITYINVADPLPSDLRLGVSVLAIDRESTGLTLSAGVNKLLVSGNKATADPIPVAFVTAWNNGGIGINAGAEFSLREARREKELAIRAGFISEPNVETSQQFATFGLGVKYSFIGLDASMLVPLSGNHPLANTMRWTLKFDMQGSTESVASQESIDKATSSQSRDVKTETTLSDETPSKVQSSGTTIDRSAPIVSETREIYQEQRRKMNNAFSEPSVHALRWEIGVFTTEADATMLVSAMKKGGYEVLVEPFINSAKTQNYKIFTPWIERDSVGSESILGSLEYAVKELHLNQQEFTIRFK